MKKEGRPWTDISEAAKCGNSIAARNRYQVLIGQQGGGAVVWEADDTASLKNLLEEGEKAKWNYIANELSRVRNKKATPVACQKKIKELFDQNPALFGIILNPQSHQHHHLSHQQQHPGATAAGASQHYGQYHATPAQAIGMPQGEFQDMLQGGSQFMGAPAMIPDYAMRR